MDSEDLDDIRERHALTKQHLRIDQVMPSGLDPHRLLVEAHADRAALLEEVDDLRRRLAELQAATRSTGPLRSP